MSQPLENGDEDERISEPVSKKVQKRVFDMEQKLHLIHYQENNPKLSYSKIGLQKLSGEPSGEDINITDDNNDDRIVESTLVCQSHTEIIQPSFVPDQFESDSDVEFQTSTSKNLNTAKKPNKCLS